MPFKILHDKNKINRNTADTIYFLKKNNFRIGQKLAYLKIWNKVNHKSFLNRLFENIIPISVLNLSDQNIDKILHQLSSYNEEIGILGYPSALESLAKYINENNINIRFKTISITTQSEALDVIAKEQIERAFHCQVCSRYSSVEAGIIAQQLPEETNYTINSVSYFVEILALESDDRLQDGELGRIVITDYYNFAMPLIRYDTGDLGIKNKINTTEGNKEIFTIIEGRKMDTIYNTKGDIVSSFILTNGMWNYSELLQYQFIQLKKKKYLFKLNINKNFYRESELIEEYKGYLGLDAEIIIEFVNEIPLLESGKRKKVMSLLE